MFKVRIRGIDQTVRWMAGVSDSTHNAARSGILKATQYLIDKVKEKFGVYQKTGGDPDGRGPWAKLTWETNKRKLKAYGFTGRPLIGSGGMRDSFEVVEGGKVRLAASIGSDDPKIIFHVYGDGKRLPMRDPIRVTAVEEMEEVRKIIKDEIENMLERGGL